MDFNTLFLGDDEEHALQAWTEVFKYFADEEELRGKILTLDSDDTRAQAAFIENAANLLEILVRTNNRAALEFVFNEFFDESREPNPKICAIFANACLRDLSNDLSQYTAIKGYAQEKTAAELLLFLPLKFAIQRSDACVAVSKFVLPFSPHMLKAVNHRLAAWFAGNAKNIALKTDFAQPDEVVSAILETVSPSCVIEVDIAKYCVSAFVRKTMTLEERFPHCLLLIKALTKNRKQDSAYCDQIFEMVNTYFLQDVVDKQGRVTQIDERGHSEQIAALRAASLPSRQSPPRLDFPDPTAETSRVATPTAIRSTLQDGSPDFAATTTLQDGEASLGSSATPLSPLLTASRTGRIPRVHTMSESTLDSPASAATQGSSSPLVFTFPDSGRTSAFQVVSPSSASATRAAVALASPQDRAAVAKATTPPL